MPENPSLTTDLTGQGGKIVKVKSDETGFEFQSGGAGGGDLVAANNLSDVANASTSRTNLGLNTNANQTDSTNKRFISDAQLVNVAAIDQVFTSTEKTKVSNLSGANTGDQDLSGLVVKANNLSDVDATAARENLDVPSNAELTTVSDSVSDLSDTVEELSDAQEDFAQLTDVEQNRFLIKRLITQLVMIGFPIADEVLLNEINN